MSQVAQKHSDKLPFLKKTVEQAREYFDDNVRTYDEFMKFVFKSSMSDDEAATLADVGKPSIEFNILEAFISKLRGEFAKQQPNLSVRSADGVPLSMINKQFTETLNLVEAHLRAIFFDGSNDMLDYNVYSDLLAGGYSVLRVFTEYVNEMSFEQNICVERVFDPTLTIFDPLARQSHKGDGRFCAELYPMSREAFEEEFGKEATNEMKFTRSLSGFDWTFQNEEEEIVLVCDYYEKKFRKEWLLKLSNGHTVTRKEYELFLKEWENRGHIEQPPIPIGEPRRTTLEYICRYRFCESKVLDYVETNYKFLPLVFVDGNSVHLKESGSYKQVTRPYVYHAKGIQRLKNFAGQSLANELENTIQHKFIVAIESIPVEYQQAYENVQQANTLVYNHFLDTNNPNVTLPPPREVARTQIPPEISNTFRMTDEMTQTILGSYDNQQVQNAPMSGIAFARSAIQSNNASVPYIVGYIKGLNRVAQMVVDMIPKYYRTPRSLPILLPNGKREYREINKQGSLYMNFDPNTMQVKVEAGVNFAMQKEIALQTVISLSQASPTFAQFFNQYGLPTLLDNIDIRGIDDLKAKAEEFQKQMAQQQQQAQQMQQQQMQLQAKQQAMEMQKGEMELQQAQKSLQDPTQAQLEMLIIQQDAQDKAANLQLKERDSETKFLEVMSKIQNADVEMELKAAEIDAENTRSQIEGAVSISKHIQELHTGANDGKEG